jgi:hypothetical protein
MANIYMLLMGNIYPTWQLKVCAGWQENRSLFVGECFMYLSIFLNQNISLPKNILVLRVNTMMN